MAKEARGVDQLDAVADRGYYNGEEIIACAKAGIAVTLPKPMTSGAMAAGRFGKQDFAHLADEDVYLCDREKLTYRFRKIENGQPLRRYWTNTVCAEDCVHHFQRAAHEAVQRRLDADPNAMRRQRETIEHPFGTIKARMGATHFLTHALPQIATDAALAILPYNFTRVTNILGAGPLIAAMRA